MPPVPPQQLAEWTLALCRTPSVTCDEDRLAGEVADWIREMGGDLVVTRVGNSVVAHGALDPDRPTVGLFGHLDTVKPAADQPVEIVGDRIFGCGASDMKAGLAVMLGLLAERNTHARANYVAVFYDKEEGPALDNGLEPLLNAGVVPALDFAFCLEPTDNRLEVGCVGGLHATVTFRGRRAHSARPWQGENAIYKATGFLERLRDRGRVAVPFGPVTYYEVMNATMAETTNSRNVVPDAFALNVNYRFAPGKSIEDAKQDMVDAVAGEADVVFIDEAPAGDVCLDHPLITAWRENCGLELAPKQAWTDVARLTARGVPAVNFGPGDTAQAHQARESASVEATWRNYQAFRAFFAG
jgi:succinyl-diaminopimelate desuccinylase